MWCVWARVRSSVRNSRTKPPTNPAIAASPASSKPSGNRSTNARASRIPAANAAEYDRPFALTSPPSKARRLAPEKPIAATKARTSALTSSRFAPGSALYLLAACASSVELEAVGADFEVQAIQASGIEGALLELGDGAARLTDQVVMMVLGQLVARAISEVQPPHRPDLREKVERAVDGHQPHPRTAAPDLLHALVLLRSQRPQYRKPLRRRPVTAPPKLPDYRPQLQPLPLIENIFHLLTRI